MPSSSNAVLAAAAVLTLVACATTTPVVRKTQAAPAQVTESGFTLTENVNVDAGTRAEYENAVRLLEQNLFEQGIASLLKVTQSAPAVAAPHIDLGIAYSRAGRLDESEASLRRALQINPNHPIAHNELGIVQRRKGRFAEARASYEKAIALVPDFHFAHLNLAVLCDLYLADFTCALDNYLAYQRAMPEDKQAQMWIADVRSRASQ